MRTDLLHWWQHVWDKNWSLNNAISTNGIATIKSLGYATAFQLLCTSKVLTCALLWCWQRMSIADPREVEINRLKTEYAELKRKSVEQIRQSETEIARLKRRNEALESELRDLRQRPSDWTPAVNPQNDDLDL